MTTALDMRGVSKAFPGVQALDDADLGVLEGEIHGLVGENGAGKSTIIKVLAGVYAADAGQVRLHGELVPAVTPRTVHELGVRFIHQELSLVPHFTVAESMFMGQERGGWLGLHTRSMRRSAEEFLSQTFGADIDGNRLIRDLSVSQRKLVQIGRALVDGTAKLIVFDEPTAVLPAEEIETLFTAIRALRDRGISMIYVSHYLSEISEICDRVTVFRNGTDVGVLDMADGVDASDIIRMMVGREITDIYPERSPDIGAPVLQVRGLGDGEDFADVDLDVRTGEIVGLAGIIGSGREALVDVLSGRRGARRGTVDVAGHVSRFGVPADAVRRGIAHVPRDRRNDGLVLDMSVRDNINLATFGDVATLGWLDRSAADERAAGLVHDLDVRPGRTTTILQHLSGGNQQKVVLARWLATDSKLFILDDPTVGVDVGARSEIYKLIADLAASGAGVIISGNDLSELMGLCDRVLVMVRGRLVADLDVDGLDPDHLLSLTTGSIDTAEVPA